MNQPVCRINAREACVALLRHIRLSVGILAGQWIALHRYLQQLEALNQPLLHLIFDGWSILPAVYR